MRFKVEAVLGKELTRRLVVVVVRDAPRVPSARLLEPERRTLLDQLCNCERGGGGGVSTGESSHTPSRSIRPE